MPLCKPRNQENHIPQIHKYSVSILGKDDMLIKVYGSKSPRLKAMVRDAIKYAGTKLMSKRMADSLEINVKMTDKLVENVAEVEWLDNHVRAKTFEITIDTKQSEMLQIISVMHEMVHVKQYATGELVPSLKHCNKSKWQGKEWVDDSKIGYYDLPWEIEAHGREKGMLTEWMGQSEILTNSEKESWRRKYKF